MVGGEAVGGPGVPQAFWAWTRSAASCCWSVAVCASSLVSVVWSCVIVLDEPPPFEAGVVVVVVVEEAFEDGLVEVDWLDSSWASFASSALTVDWSEETVSLSDVVSSVPRDCPAVTCWPTAAVTAATLPAT